MKRTFPLLLLAACLMTPAFAAAQESTAPTAEEWLVDMVGKTIVEETAKRSEEVRKAKEILEKIMKTGTASEQKEAEQDLEDARTRYAESQRKFDAARVDVLADQCGKSPTEIRAMRDSGMGWGVIAKQCGVHPSANGKARGKSKNKGKKNKDKGKKKKQ